MGITVEPILFESPEIQADTNAEIARTAALEAARVLNKPVAREDHGFFLNAVPGFPGPYMAYIEKTVHPQIVLDLLQHQTDRTGYFELALAYATPEGKVLEFVDRVACTIASEIKPGSHDFGWDKIICLGNDTRALSEYQQSERYGQFTRNFVRLAQALQAVSTQL